MTSNKFKLGDRVLIKGTGTDDTFNMDYAGHLGVVVEADFGCKPCGGPCVKGCSTPIATVGQSPNDPFYHVRVNNIGTESFWSEELEPADRYTDQQI